MHVIKCIESALHAGSAKLMFAIIFTLTILNTCIQMFIVMGCILIVIPQCPEHEVLGCVVSIMLLLLWPHTVWSSVNS